MQQGPDLAYNQSVPSNWWTTTWRPNQWCYGQNTYGGNWGSGTDGDACEMNNAYCMTYYFKLAGWSFLSACAVFGNIDREANFDPRKWERYNEPTRGFGLVQWTPMSQYTIPARSVWGDNDDWASLWWASGWYECYMICAEVFEIYRRQWAKHQAGYGHNPVNLHSTVPAANQPTPPYSNGEYPRAANGTSPGGPPPAYDFRLTFEEFVQGLIYDSTAPQDTDYEKLDYLTEAFYWDYEQVGDHCLHQPEDSFWWGADLTLTRRKGNARLYYDRLKPIVGNFPATTITNPPYLPNADTTLQDIIRLSSGGIDPKLLAAILSGRNQHRCKIIFDLR